MSHKAQQDREHQNFPWTARQRRRLRGNRETRKQQRHGTIKERKHEHS